MGATFSDSCRFYSRVIFYLVRPGRIKELAGLAESWPAVVFDCETTGLDMYLGDRLLGFAIGNLRLAVKIKLHVVSHQRLPLQNWV